MKIKNRRGIASPSQCLHRRPWMAPWVAILIAVASSLSAASSQAAPEAAEESRGALWVAEQEGMLQLSIAGELRLEVPVEGILHRIAIDHRRHRLWVALDESLQLYDFEGALQHSIPWDKVSGRVTALTVDSERGDVWLCRGDELWSVGAAGVVFQRIPLADPCRRLAFDGLSDSLWLAGDAGVSTYDAASGAFIGSAPLGAVSDLAAGPSGEIWAVTNATLARWSGIRAVPREVALARPLAGTPRLAVLEGGVWLASGNELFRLDPSGNIAAQALAFEEKSEDVRYLVADPRTGAVWASEGSALVQVTATGEVLQRIDFEPPARIRDLALFAAGDGAEGEGDDKPSDPNPPPGGDTDPPTLSVTSPLEGATLTTHRPALRFAYADAGSGVDPSTLAMTVNGQPTALECLAGPDDALCAAADELPSGSLTLSVTVDDLAGNTSSPAARQVTVQVAATPTTTLVGTLRYPDGTPAQGATVWVEQFPDTTVTAGADGTFSLAGVPVPPGTLLDFAARRFQNPILWLAFESALQPVAGGMTDLGIVEMWAECDRFVTAPSWSIDRSRLNDVHAMAVFDGGDGPEVYAGGRFNVGSTGALNRIARWRDNRWQTVGGGLGSDSQPAVDALVVWDDGQGPALYAGGAFKSSGPGATVRNLGMWNGETWRQVGGGVNGAVNGLALWDDGGGEALYVSGSFDQVGLQPDGLGGDRLVLANRIARWDGAAWSEVGGGVPSSSSGLRLSVLDDGSGAALFAWEWLQGNRIWKWSAGSWQELPAPPSVLGDDLLALVSADDGSGPALFAAGAQVLRKWNGATWITLLQSTLTDNFTSLVAFDDGQGSVLYGSGPFSAITGFEGANHLRRWDGTSWSAPLSDSETTVHVVEDLGPVPSLLRGEALAEWQDDDWSPFATGVDTEGAVTSLVFAHTPGGPSVLFAGPERAGGVVLGGAIGRWDGSSVFTATQGMGGGSKVVEADDGVERHVYGLDEATGQVAEWNGIGWDPIGDPIGSAIHDVDWIDLGQGKRLYAAGDGLFRWNGAFWAALGGPNSVVVLEEWSQQLWVGGRFPASTGQWSANLTSWNGSAWSRLDPSPIGSVTAVLGGGSELQVAGRISVRDEGVRFAGLAAWDGSDWVRSESGGCGFFRNRFLPPGNPVPALDGWLDALLRFEDGGFRPRFLVGGEYASECHGTGSSTSRLPYRNINLGDGAEEPPVRALAAGRWHGAPAVAVGGDFGEIDGVSAGGLAIWSTSPSWGSCSPVGEPPRITLTSPAGEMTTAASASLGGFLSEPARLTMDGIEIAVAPDLTFSRTVNLVEGHNVFQLEAVDRGDEVGSLTATIIRDSAPPVVAIERPADGVVVFTDSLEILVSYSDALSGVDLSSFQVTVDGLAQPPSACFPRAGQALCTVALPSSGTSTVRATVADRAGHGATAEATYSVDLSAGSTATQLVGTVVDAGGAPISGARVRILGRAGVEGLSVGDGSFSIAVSGVEAATPWTVVAESFVGGDYAIATASGVVPVPGGTSSAGVLTLAGGCGQEFSADLFGRTGVSGRVRALAVFDDGSGPAVYIGGTGLTDGLVPNNLVRWDGERLSDVAGGPTGSVYALAVYDDGSGPRLYIGGAFSFAGGLDVQGIVSWDGGTWEDLAGGVTSSRLDFFSGTCIPVSGAVDALRVFDDGNGATLFVGGNFVSVGGGISTDRVARWTATGWAGTVPAPAGCEPWRVRSFAEYDDGTGNRLYAGGTFDSLGGIPLSNIARWSGTTWEPLGEGIGREIAGVPSAQSQVNALAVYDSGDGAELIAAGLFNRAGTLTASIRNIARWDGTRWRSLDDGLEGYFFSSLDQPAGLQALAVHDDGSGPALYAAGSFESAEAERFGGSIARWNGISWNAVGGGLGDPQPGGMALLSRTGELLAGGDFDRAGATGARGIARWRPSGWRGLGAGLDGPVHALTLWDDGSGPALYVGGDFRSFGNVLLNRIGRFDGRHWQPLGGGIDGSVRSLAVHDEGAGPQLFAGGRFDTVAGVAAGNVARWDGLAWSPLANGVFWDNGSGSDLAVVRALASYDDGSGPALAVGGFFEQAGSVTTSNLARWQGGVWSGWGGGAQGEVHVLRDLALGGMRALYAGGEFTAIDGASLAHVAHWNGAAWSPLGSGLNGPVKALAPWGADHLAAGGSFAGRFSLWDGSSWSGSTGGQPTNEVLAIEPWLDDLEATLAAGGRFFDAGSASGFRIASWNGSTWRGFGYGIEGGDVFALQSFDDGFSRSLYIGGDFSTADRQKSAFLARWHRPLECSGQVPVVTWTSPNAGELITSLRPVLAVTYSSTNGSVSQSTLAFSLGGAPLAVSCNASPFSANCTPTVDLPQGEITLTATVESDAGVPSAPAANTFTIDSEGPSITLDAPADGAVLDTDLPQMLVSYSDAASGIDEGTLALVRTPSYGVQCLAGPTGATCDATTAVAEGPVEVSATIEDLAGNASTPATVAFTVDLGPPTLTIVEPADGSVVRTREPEIRVTYADPGVGIDLASLAITLEGGAVAITCNPSANEANCLPDAPLAAGFYTVDATVEDLAGKVATDAATFEVPDDLDAPVITLTAPPPGFVTNQPVTFTGSVSEDVVLTIDGQTVPLDAGLTFTYGPIAYPHGLQTVLLVATDPSGNSSDLSTALAVDTVPPELSFQQPAPGAYLDFSANDLQLTVGDNGSGVDAESFTLHLNGTQVPGRDCSLCTPIASCTVAAPPASGVVTAEATVRDLAGNETTVSRTFSSDPGLDLVPPRVRLVAPRDGLVTRQSSVRFIGSIDEPGTVTLDGASVPLGTQLDFDFGPVSLVEGENTFTLVATDTAGNARTWPVHLTRDSAAPPPVDETRVTVGVPSGGLAPVTGAAGAVVTVEDGMVVLIVNPVSGARAEALPAADGSFDASLAARGEDRLSVSVRDLAGNLSPVRFFTVPGVVTLPPDPATVAPPLDRTVATDPCEAHRFLYEGAQPIQEGAQLSSVECHRTAVVRGRVLDVSGQPLPGVTVSTFSAPELGSTLSRADGRFDLVVHGGGKVIVRLAKAGHLAAQRRVEARWGGWASLQDVVLRVVDAPAGVVTGGATGSQVVSGAMVTDSEGSRRASLLFPAGTTAAAEFPDGSTQPLPSLTVRATEFTVGDLGDEAMPGDLPATSGYTYAVEISVDEADALGATGVVLSEPVASYTDNFLSFPVGTPVPSAYYDRAEGRWVPSANGLVIALVGVSGSLADLDLDGDGQPEDAADLQALGIDAAERTELASLYSVGEEFWRVPVTHFTPYDYNFPQALPEDAEPPRPPKPRGGDADKKDTDCWGRGSVIECTNQILGEVIGLVGVPYALHYSSDRVPGRKAAFELDVSLDGGQLPASVQRIDLEVEIAGQRFAESFTATPGQMGGVAWDGQDPYGRTLQGPQPYLARVGYVYDADYGAPPGFESPLFGLPPTGPITGNPARREVTLWGTFEGEMGQWDAKATFGLGGWSLTPHHVYDAFTKTLYRGDGSRRRVDNAKILTSAAGRGTFGFGGDGGPAEEAEMRTPTDIEVSPDGSFHFLDSGNCRVRRVDSTGVITTVAGTDCAEKPRGDGGPATEAWLHGPQGLAVAPDGALYIADTFHSSVRRVDPETGIITTVRDFTGTGLFYPADVAVGPDGQLYVAIQFSLPLVDVILRMSPDGKIFSRYAGGRSTALTPEEVDRFNTFGSGGLALDAWFSEPVDLEFDAEGNLYFAEVSSHRVWRVEPGGFIVSVAGSYDEAADSYSGYSGDGGPADLAQLSSPRSVTIARDGSVLISDSENHVIRRVDPQGYITTIVGTGEAGFNGQLLPAGQTLLNVPAAVALTPEGELLVSDSFNDRVRKLDSPVPDPIIQTATIEIASEDGSVIFVFNAQGRHLETKDAQTEESLLTFHYTPEGWLERISDAFGNDTTIERDVDGRPRAIVAPFGQRTVLETYPSGYLESVTNQANETVTFEYSPTGEGLLTKLIDPLSRETTFRYAPDGRLDRDTDPAGGFTDLVRSESYSETTGIQSTTVTKTSAEGRVTTYVTEELPGGVRRSTVTQPDGTQTVAEQHLDGSREVTSADGVVSRIVETSDPRLGMQAPVVNEVVMTTPGGLTYRTVSDRQTTATDPQTGEATEITSTSTINDHTVLTVLDLVARTVTTTTPESRVGVSTYDEYGRMVESRVGDLEPIIYGYDDRGRLETVTRGTRTTTYDYWEFPPNSNGFLRSVTDPAGRESVFHYETAGRVQQQDLPGSRTVFSFYDDAGNLTALVPPSRPGHGFTPSVVDLPEQYRAPAPDGQSSPSVTAFLWDLDRRPDFVTRPNGDTIDYSYDPTSHRLSAITIPRGAYTYGYNAATGTVASITDPSGGSLA
ncbi:MAG: hypothetical protein AAF481_19920, partial [Acidobacteriota bacterium]